MSETNLVEKKVAYLGPPGTFSHSAVLAYFDGGIQLVDCPTIDDVFTAVENDEVGFGVVPVENSSEGAVNNTLDCLVNTPLKIIAEVVLPIEHHLMVKAGAQADQLKKIVSHKQSLAQCRKWLSKRWPTTTQEECASNAEAARRASREDGTAAIAGKMAAEVYGLDILESAIQDQEDNSTRFLVISKSMPASSGRDKTSTLIYTENRPGALFRVLEPFEHNQVSLTRIETRPSKKDIWDYVFFIDFEGHISDESVKQVLKKLAECTVEVKVLGSYPVANTQ
ncbi:MAG: prephenate dehydratase [Gammaproteobacteria bacterium]|nr:prephenate dehydratase [Gammaproteobacteria bacterium]